MFSSGDMEGTGDSYSEIMQRLQSSLAASSLPKSNNNSFSHLSLTQAPSHTLSNSQATLSQSQSLFQSQSHGLSQTPSSFAKSSSFLHTQTKSQTHPSRSVAQPGAQTHPVPHAPSHSRSMSQPSLRSQMPPLQSQPAPLHTHSQHSLSQPLSQPPHSLTHSLPQISPRFPTSQVSPPPPLHTRSLSQPSMLNQNSSGPPLSPSSMSQLPPGNTMSHSLFSSFNSLTPNYPVKKEASQSLSDSSARTTPSVDVTMEESSPCPPVGNGPSSNNPLSPPMNPFHSMSQRYSNDLSQMPDSPPRRRGHRRAQSEIAFRQGSAFEKELRDEAREFDRESVKESEMERERVDLDEEMDRGPGWGRERQRERDGEREGEGEGAEDLFSMYIDMEKINSFSNSGAGDGAESDREKANGNVDAGKDRIKAPGETDQLSARNSETHQRDRSRGTGDSDKEMARESWAKSGDNDRAEAKCSPTADQEKEDKNMSEDVRIGEKEKKEEQDAFKGGERENWSRKEEDSEKETSSMCVENEGGKERSENEREKGKLDRSPPFSGTHHSRSVSMDGFLSNLQGYKVGDGGQLSSLSEGRRSRHHHSNSMDGSVSLKMEFGNGEFEGIELKKAMASDKLADLALVDPKRAKRILANRQSAARSKERKMRYISELERKVQTLQTEATTLSAQLTMLQRDSTGLTTENSELKLRLQAMEQQAQLRDALNDALREEVQRLKLATGQLPSNGQVMTLGQQMSVNPQLYQLQQQLQQQAQAQAQANHQHQPVQQNSHSDFLQRSAFGALQGLAGSLGAAFLKSENSSIAVNQGSTSSF